MSDDPLRNRDRKPPPNLRLGLKDKPEVKALLAELSKDLKPGEDPLFYEMPDTADDPSACAPNEARVYAGPVAPPMAHHKTLEMDRVKVSPDVDPRRRVTLPGASPRAVGEVVREDTHGDAPPMSGPASGGPKRVGARSARKRTAAVVVLGVVAAALVVVVATRGPKAVEQEKAAASATVPNAMAVPSASEMTVPSARAPSAVPSPSTGASVAPAVVPSVPLKRLPARPRGSSEEDPYADAAVAPLPAVTVAPSAAPTVMAPLTPPIPAPARSSSLPSQKPEY